MPLRCLGRAHSNARHAKDPTGFSSASGLLPHLGMLRSQLRAAQRGVRASTSSFHGRPLPLDCVGFSSDEGKRRFGEALMAGDCEAFFPLSEQFITQDEPAFCGISSLCMVLNALRVDPGPTRPAWREDGVWRWFDERVLDLSAPAMLANSKTDLSQIKTVGVTLDEFTSLAEHNGARVQMYRPEESSEAQFRSQVRFWSTSGPYLVHF